MQLAIVRVCMRSYFSELEDEVRARWYCERELAGRDGAAKAHFSSACSLMHVALGGIVGRRL